MSGQLDGACFGKPDAAEATAQDEADQRELQEPPVMPSFLQLTSIGKSSELFSSSHCSMM